MSLERRLLAAWQRRGVLASLLLPLSWLYALVSGLRRWAYRRGWLASTALPVPVVVVGNIIVGGSGKTPFTLWLAENLRAAGWRPGIISRGYGAQASVQHAGGSTENAAARRGGIHGIHEVGMDSLATVAGDEPLLLKRRLGLPVFVGRNRVAAGQALLAAYPEVNLILSDDGLQHYRLQRTVEIALLDGRGLMNGWLLPAGPLREPAKRLQQTDVVILNGPSARLPAGCVKPWARMRLVGERFISLDGKKHCQAADLQGLKLAALAGIAVPERFFTQLENLGLTFTRHEFPDHHAYQTADLHELQQETGADALLMTEKDAVKCSAGFMACPVWVLPVAAEFAAELHAAMEGRSTVAQAELTGAALLQRIDRACLSGVNGANGTNGTNGANAADGQYAR